MRRELPGWGLVYQVLCRGADHALWADAPPVAADGKLHGYRVDLDLSRWSERSFYFLGRYYDLPTQLLMAQVLRDGDRFIDVGANIGMLTLYASRLVGADGVVEAIEPNPDGCDRLEATLERNGIRNVRLHRLGLSDASGVLELSIPETDPVEATLTASPHPDERVSRVRVPVETGDHTIGTGPAPRLIKIDTEGFECRVIDGLRRTLETHHSPVLAEVIAAHLERARTSPLSLFQRMQDLGYRGRALGTLRRRLRHELRLSPADPLGPPADVLFTHPENDPLAENEPLG